MQQVTYNRAIVYWLLSGAVLILAMVVVGGITRLTGSGLSMVEWNVISGTLPPLNEAAWVTMFEKYKQFPEYQKLNVGMTLDGFKQIFWWEYLHRLLGRFIGLVFIVPFIYFLVKRQLNGWLFERLLVILLLGVVQGFMGWIMVKSGLVDNPHVSHYRLAAHFLLALALIGVILWTVADLTTRRQERVTSKPLLKLSKVVLAAILVQIIFGAFVAGLKAGFYYNTFPLMNGEFFPSHLKGFLPWSELLNSGTVVQFVHRWAGVLVLLVILFFWYSSRRYTMSSGVQLLIVLLVLIAFVQLGLGIVTLLLAVPVSLGVLHQVVAVLLFSVSVLAVHQLSVGCRAVKA
ncbi:heme A synthase [Pontibacter qinzhouensis]|uniref:Heme A synthase n=1 Tax=Pontibacter qinzhouensis TaxID=2603253 RepID=A0A5C8K7D0_9BACT|nr:COX15/CtaA family protein [Pontibacter qinzhouensis]TXK48079.1 heme A synthase [Pontibacter qinzhouensis]